MNQITDITLILAKNELIVNDKTYKKLPKNFGGETNNFVALEFVTYSGCTKAFGVKLCSTEECKSARIILDKDGLYYYHKLYIPNIGYFVGSNTDTNTNIVGEVFVYNINGKNLLYQIINTPQNTTTVDSIIAVSEEITPAKAYESAVNAIESSLDSTQTLFIAKKPVFGI